MLLNKLHKGDRAVIAKLHAEKTLRDRFASFGIMRGEEIVVKACSLAKQTMEIEIGATAVALRAEEAEQIEVKKLPEK
ncbi:MAG TPA: ferrous iron transport protein A [Epsilonproteobacteria bacterium]|nr:ferrous iron transport protein A [Campylobacterota bacterium]